MPEPSKSSRPNADAKNPPGSGRKVVLACPTYGPVESQAARSLRAAVMHAASTGVVWAGDASPDREGFAAARNNTVESVVNTDVDGILWSDSDIIWPVDGISRLVLRGPELICGIYYQRGGDHWPLIAHYNKDKDTFNWWVKWPENAVAPIDGCGFGCVYTSIEIFRRIDPPWFEFKKFSEDFTLCLKAASAGYQLYVDTSVVCGHLADPVAIGHSDFVRRHPRIFATRSGKLKSAS